MLRQPSFLKAGDKIAIVSSARKISSEELAPAIALFESWKLEVILGETIDNAYHQFSGTDQERANDFQTQLDDPNIKAIICARGGYGTVRMLEKLDFTKFAIHPCWICGFSDVTALHTHINCYLGIQTLHCTMPISIPKNTKTAIETLRSNLFGDLNPITFDKQALNINGTASGVLIGGNLSILYSILGTSSGFNSDNRILFIEDLDEYLYHVDRMIMALKRAGKLGKLRGLIVGGMSDMNDNAIPFGKTAEEIILEHTQAFGFPVSFGFPAGHIEDNRALIFGREVTLEVGENCKLTY